MANFLHVVVTFSPCCCDIVQVLAKASKIIPVMLMGKVVSRKTYEFYEYIVAVLISLGMVAFLFGKVKWCSL